MPSSSNVTCLAPLYKIRITTLSPKKVGIVETRTSKLPDDNFSVTRPSWGLSVTLILSSDKASLSMLIDKKDEFRGDLDSLSHDGWAINRKIMNDHQIISEEIGKYRPHEIGQHVNRVSFNKGCFKGQEIIARMEYLGKLKKETCNIIMNFKGILGKI